MLFLKRKPIASIFWIFASFFVHLSSDNLEQTIVKLNIHCCCDKIIFCLTPGLRWDLHLVSQVSHREGIFYLCWLQCLLFTLSWGLFYLTLQWLVLIKYPTSYFNCYYHNVFFPIFLLSICLYCYIYKMNFSYKVYIWVIS